MSDDNYPRAGLNSAERAGGYQVVEAHRTGRPPGWTREHDTIELRRAWVRTRHVAIVRAIMSRNVPFEAAWRMGLALVAHYVRECGWGRAEWNWSLGNIRWTRGWPKAHMLHGGDDTEPRPYRAYDSLEAGAEDAVRLASTGPKNAAHPNGIYAPSWAKLLDGGDAVQWYDGLVRAGWHPWSQAGIDEFRSIYGTVRGWCGEAPPAGGAGALAALLALAVTALVMVG
jgi:hypothetical protein